MSEIGSRPYTVLLTKGMTTLTAERLHELLIYWVRSHYKHKEGWFIGSRNCKGYNCINIDGKKYLCSRLAVLYMTGKWPLLVVDHKNRRDGRAAAYLARRGNRKV